MYQLHVIGQGEYDVEQIRIEDTPITSFKEITHEIILPGGSGTLVNTDVVTAAEVAGQELLAVGDGATSGGWVGPFVANPSETTTTLLALDMIFPKGLYYANDKGNFENRTVSWEVHSRRIDDEGTPLEEWTTLAKESYTANTNTPIRKTYKYPVAAGRYEVQVLRTNAKAQLLPAKAGRLDNACKAD